MTPALRLRELVDVVTGSVTPDPRSRYEVYSVPAFDLKSPEVLPGSEIRSSKRPVTSGDVLVCKINPRINRVWVVGSKKELPQIASTEWFALRCRTSILPMYLVHLLRSPVARHVIEESVSGATGSHTRARIDEVLEIEIPVPSLAEQQYIVAKLDEIDVGVGTLLERLESELQRSLKIQRSVARDMLSASQGQMSTLGDVVSIEIGRTPPRADPAMWDPMRQSGAVWLSIADLSACRGRIISDSKEYISRAAATASKHVRAGTLMMSFKLSIGKLAFAGRDLYTNEAIAALTVKNPDRLISDFLFHYLSNVEWASFAAGNEKVKGATLNKAKLAVVPLPVPTLSEQQRIVSRLDEMQSVCAEVSENIERRKSKVEELRQSVLAAAFRGDL